MYIYMVTNTCLLLPWGGAGVLGGLNQCRDEQNVVFTKQTNNLRNVVFVYFDFEL